MARVVKPARPRAWVNSRALDLAGTTTQTPGPSRRAHRTRHPRTPDRDAARGRHAAWSGPFSRRPPRPTCWRACSGPGPAPLARHHRLAGRNHRPQGRRRRRRRQRRHRAALGADDRVLPGGDAQRVQQLLGPEQSGHAGRPPWRAARSAARPAASHPPGGHPSESVGSRSILPVHGVRAFGRRCRRSRGHGCSPSPRGGRGWAGTRGGRAPARPRIRRSGMPPGNVSMDQPPPVIQVRLGVRRGVPPRSAGGTPPSVTAPVRSQAPSSRPPRTGCTCASWNPGISSRPERSTTSVPGPTSSGHLGYRRPRCAHRSRRQPWPDCGRRRPDGPGPP